MSQLVEGAGDATYAVVDAGGTHTRLEVWRGQERWVEERLASASIASRSRAEAQAVYDDLIARVAAAAAAEADRAGGGEATVETVIATSSFDEATAPVLASMLERAAAAGGYRGRIHLCNDAIPLLFAGPPGTESVASIIGTGSAFWSRDAHDELARVGGVEWIGSDEGAATDLGKRALLAMVRAADGRQPPTSIAARAGLDADDVLRLARDLGQQPHPKQAVAELARAVTSAWTLDGDAAAAAIVAAAVADVEEALAASARHLSAPAQATWVFTGGLVAGCEPYRRLVLEACGRASGGAAHVRVEDDALELLRRFAARGWVRRLAPGFVRTVVA